VKSRIPTGRLGEIAEFSNLACYLVSDYSNWMTGSVSTLSVSLSVCDVGGSGSHRLEILETNGTNT